RDWECSNLMEIASRSTAISLTKQQTSILHRYMNDSSNPFSAAVAASILYKGSIEKPTAKNTKGFPTQPPYLAYWLVASLRKNKLRTVMNPSLKAIAKRLLKSNDPRTSFITSYLLATKFNVNVVSMLPIPDSPYSRYLLQTLGQTNINPQVDEISPLLSQIFRFKIPVGTDFRAKLGQLNPALYNRALRHLQLASWYLHTHPTYFVNHIHNFNHVLLHFVLHNGNYVAIPPLRWTKTFGEIRPNNNRAFERAFPSVANVFRECAQMRNSNLSSHPFDDRHSRFTKQVPYNLQSTIISKLRVAYKEFIALA
ncbi:hypothetical protein ACFLUG_03690, partial [Chloroflexota bacterium]